MHHDYYSPDEAAEFLNLAPVTLACWRSRGTGPAYIKLGDGRTCRIVYRYRDLDRWQKARDRQVKARERALERAAARKAKPAPKPRRIRMDGQPDRRQGWPSIATRNPIASEG